MQNRWPVLLLSLGALISCPLSAQVINEFDDDPLGNPEWELYEPVPGAAAYSTSGGIFRTTILPGVNLDHWSGADRAIQLRRVDVPEDFLVETRLQIVGSGDPAAPFFPPNNESYQAALMIYFSPLDVFYWGPYRGTALWLERSGQNGLCIVDPLLQDLSLQVKKIGTAYTFSYRADDASPWEEVCTRQAVQAPTQLGLIFKTWANLAIEETFDFDYFAIKEIPEEAPKFSVPCALGNPDRAWIGMPYTREVHLAGFPLPEVTITGPEGLTYDQGRRLLTGWTPSLFGITAVEVKATNSNGEDSLKFSVDVGSPSSRHDDDFDEDPRTRADAFWEFYEPQTGIVYSTEEIEGSKWWRMNVPAMGDLGQNWDTWTGPDRAPQLRRAIDPDQDFLIETRVRIDPAVPPAGTAPFLSGLLINFQTETDIIHWNIGQERTVAGQVTNLFLERSGINNIAHGFVEGILDGTPVRLRAERQCDLYSFYYRGENDAAWTHAGSYRTTEKPRYVGLVMKTWGAVAFLTDFDYFDFVEPGPRPIFTLTPERGPEPIEVSVDGSASSSPGGAITSYAWDFGDGATATAPTAKHTYTKHGRFPITLTVTDAGGDIGTASQTFEALFRSTSVAPWTPTNIGSPVASGGSRSEGGCLRVLAGGKDIVSIADEFRFLHQRFEGDSSITVRVADAAGTPSAKVGIMFREELTPGSPHVSMLLTRSNGKFSFWRRELAGAATKAPKNSTDLFALPDGWLRLERKGNEFIGSYSLNGTAWTELSRITLANMPAAIYGGLAATPRDLDAEGLSVEVVNCDIATTGAVSPPAAPTLLAAAGGAGSVSLDWADNADPGLAGYNVHRSTTAGGPYAKVNAAPVASSGYVDTGLVNGTPYFYVVTALGPGGESAFSNEAGATPAGGTTFRRGDADGNAAIELTDAISLLNYLFTGGVKPVCLDAADFDDNGDADISDAIANLNYQFLGGPQPAAPGPTSCGPDVNVEATELGCDAPCV